ncbi:MAG: uroporphyrinogen decarboxylase [Deltaproteobacteria bacterium]|nr:uroporphyrinogen decarboxylase [Deltaproteobacteria bacterium]
MEHSELFSERLDRIKTAVSLQAPDRVPVVLEYGSFAAHITGTPLPEYLLNLKNSVNIMIEAFQRVTEKAPADAINYGSFSPYLLSYLWLSKIGVPGVDLPDTASHQVLEKELMKPEDYDAILEKGWPAFHQEFIETRVLNDVPEKYWPLNQPAPDVLGQWTGIDTPVLSGGTIGTPFEFLCGGRSLTQFFMDLLKMPDKLQEVMDAMMPHLCAPACEGAKNNGFPTVWVGGWRTAPVMLSPQSWDRFVWPYFVQIVEEVLAQGLIPILHLDANWDRELARFRELPKGKCIMALDGDTDIFKAKEILGDHMCLMGDVPPSMLVTDSPDEVYAYANRLIREVGKEGFILQSGCDIPENAKLENVQAMVAAANDS